MKRTPTLMADRAMNLLFPPDLYCTCCGNLIDETRTYHLCDHCIAHIRWDGEAPMEKDGLQMLRCAQYGIYERTMIFSLKYNGKTYIARDIAAIMADRLSLTDFEYDCILPVPMHRDKERQRGFNQAALMGKYLSKLVERPCLPHGLIRTAQTRPMRGLSPAEREQNVRNKFAVNPAYAAMLQGKSILLIDDFYTTGSTARACRQALSAAGSGEVYFLAFAAK